MNPLASFELDYNSGLPVWIQVKNRIATSSAQASTKRGDQLPTVRSLAVDLDISYNTVNRATWIWSERVHLHAQGEGTFVAERHAVAPPSPPTTPSSCWRTI